MTAVEVMPLGLADDAVVDVKHHGGHDQAVYVYGAPDYACGRRNWVRNWSRAPWRKPDDRRAGERG